MTRKDLRKYFWSLNEKTFRETQIILKHPHHRRFPQRMTNFLSRCDRPKELFSLISKEQFVEVWPAIKAYWRKIAMKSDFRSWWQTVYEQILQDTKTRRVKVKGKPAAVFLKIGKNIREARIKKGLSQNELALKTMMKQPDISMIEEGKKNATLNTLMRLCTVLGIKKIEI